jgi:hypothetical protein
VQDITDRRIKIMDMSLVLNEFSEMRFKKSVIFMNRNYPMNGAMYRLFFALDENTTMLQLASRQQMELAVMMESIVKLWNMRLIEPIGLDHLVVDSSFSKLLQINLHYILGNKKIAYSCVDSAIKDLGLASDQLSVGRVTKLVKTVATKISDARVQENFRDFMEALMPLRTKMQPFWGSISTNETPGTTKVSRGKTRQIIDRIISARSGGNQLLAKNIKTKLMLKGINPDSYFDDTPDDDKMLNELRILASKMGVDLERDGSSAASSKQPRGQIRRLLHEIIESRAKQNPFIVKHLKAKLLLKGIDVDRYGPNTPDDPVVLDKLKKLALSMSVKR